MTAPRRIQRRRTRGWTMPEGAVYVGRPTRWGNPFVVGDVRPSALWADPRPARRWTPATATAAYRQWLTSTDPQPVRGVDRAVILQHLHHLAGRDLACWCPLVDAEGNGVPCHADVLLELANSPNGANAAVPPEGATMTSPSPDARLDEALGVTQMPPATVGDMHRAQALADAEQRGAARTLMTNDQQEACDCQHAEEHPMTPTNNPRELLNQLDALREVGTEEPWSNPYPFDKLIDGPGPFTNMAMIQCDPQLTAALRAVLDLHRPWYEVNGVRHENTVQVGCDQYSSCDGTSERYCPDGEDDGHEVLACSECRYVVDYDLNGYLLWPCPTVAAIAAALTPGEVTA